MGTKSLRTKLGNTKLYEVSGVMGFKRYGLRGVRLYIYIPTRASYVIE